MGDQPVAHVAAVDVGVLQVGAGAGGLGQADAAVDLQRAGLRRDLAAGGDELLAQHVTHTLLGRAGAPLFEQPAFVPDRKRHRRPRQRVAAHRFEAVRQLGGVGLQELAPRRRGKEQLAHLDRGADRARRRRQLAAARVDAHRVRAVGGAAGDGQLGHRAQRGQRLAAETHRADLLQIVEAGDLAGGVALEGQRQLVGRDAGAVVLDQDGAHAARGQPQRDLASAGVERVVEQLAHHRAGALDHLAGGDLADQLVGQFTDGAARWGGARRGGRGERGQGHGPGL